VGKLGFGSPKAAQISLSIRPTAVTETVPEPKTAFLVRTVENWNRCIFWAKQAVLTEAILSS